MRGGGCAENHGQCPRLGGFEWHAFSTGLPIDPIHPPLDTSAGRPFEIADCTKYMRTVACKPDSLLQKATLFYGLTRNPDCKLIQFHAQLAVTPWVYRAQSARSPL